MESEEILYNLLKQESLDKAPNIINLHGEWYEAVIPIGADNTATILLGKDDWEMLCDRNG